MFVSPTRQAGSSPQLEHSSDKPRKPERRFSTNLELPRHRRRGIQRCRNSPLKAPGPQALHSKGLVTGSVHNGSRMHRGGAVLKQLRASSSLTSPSKFRATSLSSLGGSTQPRRCDVESWPIETRIHICSTCSGPVQLQPTAATRNARVTALECTEREGSESKS